MAFSEIDAPATIPCRAIAEPRLSALRNTAITSWRSTRPSAVWTLMAGSRPNARIAMFSMPTARQPRMTKAAPAAASTVAGPCPRMRTERTLLSSTGALKAYWPGPRQTVPPVCAHLVDGVLDGELAAGVRLWAVTQAVQLQSWPSPRRRPGMPAVGHRARADVPDAEPRVVVVDAARRRAIEQLDRGVGGARGEHPVVARLETLGAGRGEARP